MAELREAGFELDFIGQLREQARYWGVDPRPAFPILMKWLPKMSWPPLRSDIARTLSHKSLKPVAAPVLIAEFKREVDPTVKSSGLSREAAAIALEVVADESFFDQIAELALAPSYGELREPLVDALAKMKHPRRAEVLEALLDDEHMCWAAIDNIGKKGFYELRDKVKPFLQTEDKRLRKLVEKSLERLDKAEAKAAEKARKAAERKARKTRSGQAAS
ncbi:MAG: HEAT repeat domain-containing protein [Alphaproteobacteria bacterium]|nr:HEAT repeat domain-containing protein [Alphaproteobacteria bacterium]